MHTPKALQASFSFDAESCNALSAAEAATANSPHLSAWAPERWPVAQDWRPVVDQFLASDAGRKVGEFIRGRLASGAIIYPHQPFWALLQTPLAQVRVVIVGQDPYHGPGQAQGLAFSVAPGVKPPPSLRNIFKEVARDPLLGNDARVTPTDGSLVRWAQQGVLLLNTCLTVEAGQPASHAQRGWESLTDAILAAVAMRGNPVVFMLWGAHAQSKQDLIVAGTGKSAVPQQRHLLLTANHPSPLSALRPPKPFIGCGHFGLANDYLHQHGCCAIYW